MPVHPFIKLWKDLYCGLIKYKYPICCVIQFCYETVNSKTSWLERKNQFGLQVKGLNYVPCNICAEKERRGYDNS